MGGRLPGIYIALKGLDGFRALSPSHTRNDMRFVFLFLFPYNESCPVDSIRGGQGFFFPC